MYEIIYKDIEKKEEYEEIVKTVLDECFKEEGLENAKLYITITLTNPENIREINKKYRNIDYATDVLSFPMFTQEELKQKMIKKDYTYEDMLGDIVISIKKVEEQAQEYGHSFRRELSYMIGKFRMRSHLHL